MSQGRTIFYNTRRRHVSMPIIDEHHFDDIDFSSFPELEYPIPHEGGSIGTPCVIQPGESGLSKASDGILKAMEKQAKRFPF